ncbi:MAG: tRNA (guanosine(37)-N1)-methyltransferase TrmD [Treponema sp.]|jgi:tRNA (guanine37-N1)-methyltransferase|nr:tRNA (guanosine(37)-N1)-methyltransferase TrmD [Treponema sp.]
MKYTVLTLFPEITDAYFATSIMAKAIQRGIIEYQAINIRDFALDRHKTCDDAPYGGGPGMLMLPEPLSRALEAAGISSKEENIHHGVTQSFTEKDKVQKLRGTPWSYRRYANSSENKRVICLSPSGRPFNQALAEELARERELVLLCGRYEGIDQRVIDRYIDDEVSVGDYVLSSGEIAALALIDATYRLVDRVITSESLDEESFSGGLLEYPQYTRPEIFDTMKVPDVLLSGHHENIRRWRLEQRVKKTLRCRPDLIRRGRELGLFDEEINRMIGDIEHERN